MSPEDVMAEDGADDRQSENTEEPGKPSLTPRAALSKAERADRVAAEMRRNLLKRKQQQRQKQSEI